MARLVHEADLAWRLALAVKPHLDTVERNDIFVALGAGDTFSAMRRLLKLVAVKKIRIGPQLVRQCISWLEGHVQQNGEYFRHLVESIVSPEGRTRQQQTPGLRTCNPSLLVNSEESTCRM
jgi:hypothetical protein